MAKWDKPPTSGGGGQPTNTPGGTPNLGGLSSGWVVITGELPQNPLYGSDPKLAGVTGESNTGPGVVGRSVAELVGLDPLPGTGASDGVQGESIGGNGIHGISHAAGASGVWGVNKAAGFGVAGETTSDYQADPHKATAGVRGLNYGTGTGVMGISNGGDGTLGISFANSHAGVSAVNYGGGTGVWGSASGGTKSLDGVASSVAVSGNTDDGTGVRGISNTGVGVEGSGGLFAGRFFGTVSVIGDQAVTGTFFVGRDMTINNGNVTIRNGNLSLENYGDVLFADFAEDFAVLGTHEEPGTVMVIDHDNVLRPCHLPYDKRVAGVISGAGNFRPGIILGKQSSNSNVVPIALVGKVFCKVDAGHAPIQIGDLLTTSPTPGNAMKVIDPLKALGSIIGKALGAIKHGKGLIPILVALQ
jgi:hypothetical protein